MLKMCRFDVCVVKHLSTVTLSPDPLIPTILLYMTTSCDCEVRKVVFLSHVTSHVQGPALFELIGARCSLMSANV